MAIFLFLSLSFGVLLVLVVWFCNNNWMVIHYLLHNAFLKTHLNILCGHIKCRPWKLVEGEGMWQNLPRIPLLYTNYNVALHCFLLGMCFSLAVAKISQSFVCCCYCGMLTRNDDDIYSFQTIISKDERWCHLLWISIKNSGDTSLNLNVMASPELFFTLLLLHARWNWLWFDMIMSQRANMAPLGQNGKSFVNVQLSHDIFFLPSAIWTHHYCLLAVLNFLLFWFKDIMSTW